MRYIVFVQVFERRETLAHYHSGFLFCESFPLDHKVEQLPSLTVAINCDKNRFNYYSVMRKQMFCHSQIS
jgi:hypothetical protein